MKDNRLVDLRLKADRDKRLSNAGSRLFSLVVAARYHSTDPVEDDFPVTRKLAAAYLDWSEDTSYRALNELVDLGYLVRSGLRGSPPKAYYRFLLASAGVRPNYRKSAGIEPRKIAGNDSGKIDGNLISNPFRKELNRGNEFEGDESPGRKPAIAGGESIERSAGTRPAIAGGEAIDPSKATDWTAAAAADLGVDVKELADFEDERKRWMDSRGQKASSRGVGLFGRDGKRAEPGHQCGKPDGTHSNPTEGKP